MEELKAFKAELLKQAAKLKPAEQAYIAAAAEDVKKLKALMEVALHRLPKARGKVDWKSVLTDSIPILVKILSSLAS